MRWAVAALLVVGLMVSGCTPAEACEDIADDTASALAEWAEIRRPGDNIGEPDPPLTGQKRAIPILSGARERFEAAGCSDDEVTELLRSRVDTVSEALPDAEFARQMLANGADGIRELDASFGTRDDPPSTEAP